MDVEVAQAAFVRLRDVRSVELVNRVTAGMAAGTPANQLLADVAAWQGDFDKAAKLYVDEGQLEKVGNCSIGAQPAVSACLWLFQRPGCILCQCQNCQARHHQLCASVAV